VAGVKRSGKCTSCLCFVISVQRFLGNEKHSSLQQQSR
jgi:hypothetical protein